jgi:hypothetical protein
MDHHEQRHQHYQKEREEEKRHHQALERAHGKKSLPSTRAGCSASAPRWP